MKNRNLAAVCAASLILSLGLGACGDDDAAASDPQTTEAPDPTASGEEGLYFEIRYRQSPMNPISWLR